jgi:transmembrane sensor
MDKPPDVTPEIAAEAAVWMARLHGPDRSDQMVRDCRQWQERSAAHRLAFEKFTDTWQDVASIRVADAYASASASAPLRVGAWRPGRNRWAVALTLVVMVVAGALYFEPWRDVAVYSTEVGGQQMVVLADGTRMSLNTDTRVRVELGSRQRSVKVEAGEALFEVAKDPARPFVVRVGGSEVEAVGTVFSVRFTSTGTRASDSLAVTLIEGKVTVRPAVGSIAGGVAPPQPVQMSPGQRVRLSKSSGAQSGAPQVDRPRLDQVVAWKRSEAVFDDVSLADAVAEMNRYCRTPIVLLDESELQGMRVSGVFRTGDNAAFARAVAALHGLVVREKTSRFELAPG